ncbi:MAG: MgtC/SapB family protein [Proteobacteria bacterium]|nr:MgtC/SapB family protein [Pseudomonadota bacterium]
MISFNELLPYWTGNEISINIVVFLNLLGALVLGLLVGYERSYHGRAAGMRTFGLVCMASAALTVMAGYPEYWYGARAAHVFHNLTGMSLPDPTRIIQGTVTGIGFLGAGVIVKDGFSISGLTTAASIWTSAVIGVMVGLGFYASAIMLSVLSAGCMIVVSRLQGKLPSRQAIAMTLKFNKGFVPREAALRQMARERGYEIASGTIAVNYSAGQAEWHFVAIANHDVQARLTDLAQEMSVFEGVDSFHLSYARN